jgi:hypothetical protein
MVSRENYLAQRRARTARPFADYDKRRDLDGDGFPSLLLGGEGGLELTELGRKLIVPLKALSKWARENRPAMLAAREAFQRRGQHGSPRSRFTVPK